MEKRMPLLRVISLEARPACHYAHFIYASFSLKNIAMLSKLLIDVSLPSKHHEKDFEVKRCRTENIPTHINQCIVLLRISRCHSGRMRDPKFIDLTPAGDVSEPK